MDLQNIDTSFQIRLIHDDPPVQTAGTQKGLIQDLRPVGGRQNKYTLIGIKAVHLGKELV